MSILVSGGRLRATDRSLELHTTYEPSRRLKFSNHGEGPYHRVHGLLLVERHYGEIGAQANEKVMGRAA